MKTKFAISAIALALTSASAFAAEIEHGVGTINLDGEVTAVSCTVDISGADAAKTITLTKVPVSTFEAANTAYEPTSFDISLTGCKIPTGKTATLAWTSDNANTNDYLDNTTAGAAGNTQLVLRLGESNVVTKADGANASTPIVVGTPITYNVAYITTDVAGVDVGKVTSTVTYNISYN